MSEIKNPAADPDDPGNNDYYVNGNPVSFEEYNRAESDFLDENGLDNLENTDSVMKYTLNENEINKI